MKDNASLVDLISRLRKLPKSDRKMLTLDGSHLADAFHQQRERAPRRAQGYLSSTRAGVTPADDTSNRAEERLAATLFRAGGLRLEDGSQLTFLDYQFPLKSVRADAGIGKVDLLGILDDGTLVVAELKMEGNREDRRIAILEGLAYAAVVEANLEQIAEEVLAIKGRHVRRTRPAVVLLAPLTYWTDIQGHPRLTDLLALLTSISTATPIGIMPMSLDGLNAAPVDHQTGPLVPFPGGARTETYRSQLHRRFWAYSRSELAPQAGVFDPRHLEGRSPPVFRPEFADLNILTPPGRRAEVLAALEYLAKPGSRHRWFGSMASSQALAQTVFANLSLLGRLDALEGIPAEDGAPAFFTTSSGHRLLLEHEVTTMGEPRPTSLDTYFDGPTKVAVEVKFTEAEFGRCSRPSLRSDVANYTRDYCDGSFSFQHGRVSRCSLSERGIRYWNFVPEIFSWSNAQDHLPCPLMASYQLVRNVLAVCIDDQGSLDPNRGHALVIYDARNPAFQREGAADLQWASTTRALRFPQLLRRVSWQALAAHLSKFDDLGWLTGALSTKYGISPFSKGFSLPGPP